MQADAPLVAHAQRSVALSMRHVRAPHLVDSLKAAPLGRHLAHDVLGVEDGLQVQPRALTNRPLIQDSLCIVQLVLPVGRLDCNRSRKASVDILKGQMVRDAAVKSSRAVSLSSSYSLCFL